MNKIAYEIKACDKLTINYDGRFTKKIYAGTIHSRKKYTTLVEFRTALYQFLHDIGYSFAIQGVMEYHSQPATRDKVHCHVFLYSGQPPKDNRKNPFVFRMKKLTDLEGWTKYIHKEIEHTLDRENDVLCGIINMQRHKINLFTDKAHK